MLSIRLLPVLLLAPAAAQAPLDFTIDQSSSNWHWDGDTSLGPLEGNPSQDFQLAGNIEIELESGAQPIATGRLLSGGVAAIVPDISAVIPNPIPNFPPLAQIDVVGVTLGMTAPSFPISAVGDFTANATLTILSGTAIVTPIIGNQTQTDLTGTIAGPGPMNGTITQAGTSLSFNSPYVGAFDFVDSGSGISLTLNLTGSTVADYDCAPALNYCSSNPNSTGSTAMASASGSFRIQDNGLVLSASQLPTSQFGYFIMSDVEGFVPDFGGSDGNLCLGGSIVRFAKDVLLSDGAGQVSFSPDLTNLPQATAFEIGETWRFQYWTRDGQSSNTTDGVAVTFCP